MAAWASLSGYLFIKPGGGGLSRLKSRKKHWCVLDESRGQLLYHKSEEDARCKAPLGYIELRGAAITLDLDNQNQFVIIVDNKEVFLTAENHESMMIWLMALQEDCDRPGHRRRSWPPRILQSKRDLFAKYVGKDGSADSATTNSSGDPTTTTSTTAASNNLINNNADRLGLDEQRERSSSDVSVSREGGHRPLCASKSLQYQERDSLNNNNNHNYHSNITNSGQHHNPGVGDMSVQLRRQHFSRLGETFDSGSSTKKSHGGSFHPVSRQLSVSMEGTELLQRHPHHQKRSQGPLFPNGSHGANIHLSTPSPLASSSTTTTTQPLESSSSGSMGDSDDLATEDSQQRQRRRQSRDDDDTMVGEGEGQSRESSLSCSSDSAIEKGDNSEMAVRVQELEKELISSKCELAKVLNRQTCFQDILKQKDEIILDLDEKLGKLGGVDMAYDSKRRANQATKELQERIRILQNQNRFLNEEVRRLARLRSQELSKIKDQDSRAAALEGDIELWKLEYVSLIQSSIRFTNTDTMDDAELSLYGGDRHKNRVRSLLEEARKINPSLPTFENLSAGEVHVDYYGFKHQFQDSGLLLHYLCMELTQHYLSQAAAYERHQVEWQTYVKNNAKNLLKSRKELKQLCRLGVPDQHRRYVWRTLIHDKVADMITEKGPHYFRSLCSMLPDSPLAARYRKQISLDLMRTMPSNIKFSTPGSKGIMDLQDVLLAFCIHNPNVGYCQGMNFLVAMALLFMDAQDAFWTLVAVTERYHTASYFDQNLLGAQADQSVLRDLLADLLPNLARHLDAIDIEISTVTLNWFLAIFFDAVPFPTLLRVWDCFLLEGPKVLFRFSLAILKLHEREIVHKTETISVMRHLKACARVTYDVDGLVQLAFKGLKPFPRRQDIHSKQTVYLKALKEKYRWRELQKLAFAERENLFLSLESETGSNSETFECCVVTETGEVWVCYGGQSQCKVCVVDCTEGTMTDLPVQFASRVMALCTVPSAILFGSLSWTVYCYRTDDRSQAWEQQLNDAVLSLCQYEDEGACRVFAGLADGTVAVLEDVSVETTFYDLMYIVIGQSPVTCLRLVDSHLWCACGNTVSIIHASTLDALDSFTVSSNPYDHILSLQPGLPGVWISVRGSSILELWDPSSLCCKMLYDTRAGRYPCLRKDDEIYFNRARITCILPLDYSVWVGTGEGNLITYDVFTHQGSKTPSDSSSFVGSYTDSFSAFVGKEETAELPGNEGFDPVREAAMRVRQLYLCQQDPEEDTLKVSHLTVSTCSTLVNNSTESVSHENHASDANTTLTASEPVVSSSHGPDTSTTEAQSGDGPQVEAKSTEGTSGVEALSPGVLSPGEDSEGITPTTSFCCDSSNYTSAAELAQVTESQGEKSLTERQEQKGTETAGSTECKADTETADVSVGKDSEITEKDASSKRSGCDSVKTESQTEQNLEALRSKSASPKNGIHMFYIGESNNVNLKKILPNGSVAGETDGGSLEKNSDSAADNNMNKANSLNEENKTDSNQRAEEASDQSTADCTKTEDPHERGTSESGVDVGSSDGSVIMQVWSALTKPRKPRNSSQDSQPVSQPLSSQGSQVDEVEAETAKKPTLKATRGSSLTSSIDSKHSDEVFQDANEDINTAEECTSTSVTTPLEESQYETGQENLSHNTSYQSLTDPATDASSNTQPRTCTDPEEGKKAVKKKRPQSLFINRAQKPNKASAGCVDKHDSNSRGRFVVGSPPTPNHSGSKSASTSSLNTRASSESVDNLQPADREAQYRLDYTNLHVDTDLESVCTDASLDSRRSSSVFSEGKFDPEVRVKADGWRDDYEGSSEDGDGGLGMLDCDPSSFIFPQDMYNLKDNNGTVGRAMMNGGSSQLLMTPAMSILSSRTWSSYDEVSTPSVASFVESSSRTGRYHRSSVTNGGGTHLPRNNSLLSATSVASTTELLYAADMTLMSKNKISDKPVKCLLLYTQESKPLVLSFSGCHNDDEAVLRWSREKDEMLWTNDPVLEYNPTTKTTKLPSYMKARMSSSSSSQSLKQRLSQGSQ